MAGYTERRNAANLKRLVRLIYLYGCFSKTELPDVVGLNRNSLYKEYQSLATVFDDTDAALELYDKHDDRYMRLDADWLLQNENYLVSTYFAGLFSPAVLVRCQRVAGYLAQAGPTAFPVLLREGGAIGGQEAQTLRNFLDKMAELGYFTKRAQGRSSVYGLAACPFDALDDGALAALYYFVDLMCHTGFPAYHGHILRRNLRRLMARRGLPAPAPAFVFSGALFHALLDEDVLMALEPALGKALVTLDYRPATAGTAPTPEAPADKTELTVLPLRFLFDGRHGRGYLLAWDEARQAVVQLRLSAIFKVRQGAGQAPPPQALRQLEQRYARCFCAAPGSEEDTRLRLRFDLAALEAAGQGDRPLRELPAALVAAPPRREGTALVVDIAVATPGELVPWLRGFGAAVGVEGLPGDAPSLEAAAALRERMAADLREVLALYG